MLVILQQPRNPGGLIRNDVPDPYPSPGAAWTKIVKPRNSRHVKFRQKLGGGNSTTPRKMNMEPINHPFRKENDLNQTSMIVFHVNFAGVYFWFSPQKLGEDEPILTSIFFQPPTRKWHFSIHNFKCFIAAKMWLWTVEAVEVEFVFLFTHFFWRKTFCVRNIWWHLCHAKGLVSTTGTLWWGYERMGRWGSWRASCSEIRRYTMHDRLKKPTFFFFASRVLLVKVSSEWLKLFVIYIVCHVLYRRFSYQLNQDIRLYNTNHLFQDAYIQTNHPVQGSARISM